MAKIKATIKKDSPSADIIKAAKAKKQTVKEAIESGNSKQQTAVTWLINELIQNRLMALRYDSDNTFGEIIKKAKQMEKEQIENARPQIISNCVIKEISNEEIEKAAYKYSGTLPYDNDFDAFQSGAKWYREQLKKK